MKNSLAIFLIVWMLCPKQAGAQISHSITQSGSWLIDADTMTTQKKDTISVPILCERALVCGGITVRNGAPYLQDVDLLGVEILFVQQERTLEWRTVLLPSPPKNGISIGIYATETKWVVTETRWLESKGRCYQLIPIEEQRH
jgi:hypothetical protein